MSIRCYTGDMGILAHNAFVNLTWFKLLQYTDLLSVQYV